MGLAPVPSVLMTTSPCVGSEIASDLATLIWIAALRTSAVFTMSDSALLSAKSVWTLAFARFELYEFGTSVRARLQVIGRYDGLAIRKASIEISILRGAQVLVTK